MDRSTKCQNSLPMDRIADTRPRSVASSLRWRNLEWAELPRSCSIIDRGSGSVEVLTRDSWDWRDDRTEIWIHKSFTEGVE